MGLVTLDWWMECAKLDLEVKLTSARIWVGLWRVDMICRVDEQGVCSDVRV